MYWKKDAIIRSFIILSFMLVALTFIGVNFVKAEIPVKFKVSGYVNTIKKHDNHVHSTFQYGSVCIDSYKFAYIANASGGFGASAVSLVQMYKINPKQRTWAASVNLPIKCKE